MLKYILILTLLITQLTFAQNNKQNIRGVVIDKLSQAPLIGATVKIMKKSETKGAISNKTGNYKISELAPDRYELKISYIGYKNVFIPNIVVNSGKETILDISMEEEFKLTNEVVVTANEKDKTINDLAIVSTREFSMEEVNRYAGGRSDPARLVANFAGVSATDDSRNDIVIRGNSPVGVLWRINGMNVTNPNHFATVGTTGSAVSALNTNMLKSSDFLTSAFPAEYGNAISGVFDIGFRNGNSQKSETTIQAGVITGLEATTEGPISQESNSSYLVGYRYALAGVAQAIGIDIGTSATPSYQDLSFNLNSGNTNLGKFTLFGILATSSINISSGSSGSVYGGKDGHDLSSKIGIVGLNHLKLIDENSFFSSNIGLNYSKTDQTDYAFDRRTDSTFTKIENKVSKTGINFATSYNSKISSRLFIKVGVQDELIGLYLYDRERDRIDTEMKQIWDYNSFTNLAQAFIHLKNNIGDRFTFNAGLHSQMFFLNNSFSVEPRMSLKYELNEKSSLNFGYGLHSQIQPINVYFLQSQNVDGTYSYLNKNLDFIKSHHLVLGYNLQPFDDWRIKAEMYNQYLYSVPINTFSSIYSMLNTGVGFKTDLEDSLTNAGTGKNYGFELTIEKFFSDGYYGLFTSSIYESKYTASDGVERNSAFNGKYALNFLFGKEWSLGNDKLSSDLKVTNAGGRYYTPFDLEASQSLGHGQLKSDAYVYSSRYENYFRLDLKVSYTINSNSSKLTHSFALDLQNITNNKNVFSMNYDDKDRAIKTIYQIGFFPNFTYKFQF